MLQQAYSIESKTTEIFHVVLLSILIHKSRNALASVSILLHIDVVRERKLVKLSILYNYTVQ